MTDDGKAEEKNFLDRIYRINFALPGWQGKNLPIAPQ
jgi:hypothetical protein